MQDVEHDPTLSSDPVVDRMWIVRAADWIAGRRFAIALMIIGAAILTIGMLRTAACFTRPTPYLDQRTSETHFFEGGGSSGGASHLNNIDMFPAPYTLSVMIVAGAGICFLAFFLKSKRFSLRRLILAVLVIGALGSIPSYIPKPRGVYGHFSIGLNQPLPGDDIAAIEKALQLSVSLEELPSAVRSKLNNFHNAGIVEFHVSRYSFEDKSPDGMACEIVMDANLDSETRFTVLGFFEYYLKYLVLTAGEKRGFPTTMKAEYIVPDQSWEPYLQEWLNKRKNR